MRHQRKPRQTTIFMGSRNLCNPLRCSRPFSFKLRYSCFHGGPLHRRCLPNRRFGQRSCSRPFPFKLRYSRFHGRPLHRRCLSNHRFGQRSCSRPFPFKLRYSRFHGRPLHRRCLPNRRFGQRSIAALGSRGAQLYLQRFCMNNARRGVQRACLPALRCRAAAHQPFYRQQKSLPLRRNRKGRLCAAMFGGLPRIKC